MALEYNYLYDDDEFIPWRYERNRRPADDRVVGKDYFLAGELKSTFICEAEVPLKEHDYKLFVELMMAIPEQSSPSKDIVLLLDVSSSMVEDKKLEHLKAGAKFVINKLRPRDRLSVVIFEGEAYRLCRLLTMSRSAKNNIEEMIENLQAGGGCNINAGLTEALKVLVDRSVSPEREHAILLMSDGHPLPHNADGSEVSVDNVPVYTISLGNPHSQVLNNIAIRSKGGKFTVVDVKDIHTSDNVILVLNSLVTELFGGQITKDVKLTITTERHSKIKEVYAGRYPHSFDDSGSVTISFGHLAPEERRSASVLLALEEVQKPCGMEVAEYIVSHGERRETWKPLPIIVTVVRATTPMVPKSVEILIEEHNNTVKKIKEARELADAKMPKLMYLQPIYHKGLWLARCYVQEVVCKVKTKPLILHKMPELYFE